MNIISMTTICFILTMNQMEQEVLLSMQKKYLRAQALCMKTTFTESVWISIATDTHDRLVIGCVYRSPNSPNDNNDKLELLIKEAIAIKATKLVIMGDFNLP